MTPYDISSIVEEAGFYLRQNQPGAARETLNLLTDLSAHTTETLHSLGNICLLLKDYEGARLAYSQALVRQPPCAGLLAGLAVAYQEKKEVFENFLSCALALEPNHPDALKLLADYKTDAGCHREAALVYHRLIGRHPDQVEIFMALANCFSALDRWASARRALKRAKALIANSETSTARGEFGTVKTAANRNLQPRNHRPFGPRRSACQTTHTRRRRHRLGPSKSCPSRGIHGPQRQHGGDKDDAAHDDK